MTIKKSKDYYEILGVGRNASEDEIKSAYRNRAKDLSPKVHNVPEGQKPDSASYEAWLEVNEAYKVLIDTEKRTVYDHAESLKKTETDQSRRQSSSTSQSRNDINYAPHGFGDSFLNDLFNNSWTQTFVNGNDIFGSSSQKHKVEKSYVFLTKVDIGLFNALKDAYDSDSDGKWDVKKDDKDNREHIPEIFYRIVRENGEVRVFRTVADWRSSIERKNPIEIRDKDKPWDYSLD